MVKALRRGFHNYRSSSTNRTLLFSLQRAQKKPSLVHNIWSYRANLRYCSILDYRKITSSEEILISLASRSFTMSVTWTYIIAQELVSLLISLGNIFGISPSVLELTVLAWDNSLSDLIANVTVAVHGGSDGAQIALSGCYAGPLFNMIIGLGVPLVISSLAEYPRVYIIPDDNLLLETLGFLVVGLLWALVIMLRRR